MTLVGIAVVVTVSDPELEARIMLSTMTILAWTFCALYTRFDWRATVGGKALMYTSAALGLIGAQLASVWWLGDYTYRNDVRSLVMIILVDTVLYWILILWQIRRVVDGEGEVESHE